MHAIEACAADGRLLRVEFVWRGDRFGHVISLVDADGARPLLESVEGSLADAWPPSPPLQSLTIETRQADSRVALLVGMAGRSHWSASIEALPDRAELRFDMACRHTELPAWLGSSYAWQGSERNSLAFQTELGEFTTAAERVAIQPRATAARTSTCWRFAIRPAAGDSR
jgi:hypothetical protein